MIKHTTIVICDACGKCVQAKDDEYWFREYDVNITYAVHNCPFCNKELIQKVDMYAKENRYAST